MLLSSLFNQTSDVQKSSKTQNLGIKQQLLFGRNDYAVLHESHM